MSDVAARNSELFFCECQLSPNVQVGQTPFLAAAAMGHVEVAGFLLDNGSSILERADVSDYHFLGRHKK